MQAMISDTREAPSLPRALALGCAAGCRRFRKVQTRQTKLLLFYIGTTSPMKETDGVRAILSLYGQSLAFRQTVSRSMALKHPMKMSRTSSRYPIPS